MIPTLPLLELFMCTKLDIDHHQHNYLNITLPPQGSLARQMEDMAQNSDGYSFSSQQVYSYRNDGSGEPQEYQAISSTAKGPGGVCFFFFLLKSDLDRSFL